MTAYDCVVTSFEQPRFELVRAWRGSQISPGMATRNVLLAKMGSGSTLPATGLDGKYDL